MKKGLIIVGLTVLLLLSACSFDLDGEASRRLQGRLKFPEADPTAAPTIVSQPPPEGAYRTLAALAEMEAPQRDMVELAQRLRNVGEIPLVVRDTPYNFQVGDKEQFWVSNTDSNSHYQITAALQHVTPHLYVWVETGVPADLEALRTSAERFETQTYPTNQRIFGREWSPGVDSDEHLNILHAQGLGGTVGGYYSSSDEFSHLAHEYSNEREMFYVNLDTVEVGSAFYNGLLAHEFQHMIHWHMDRNEDLWLNEGLSELAAYVNGFDPGGSEVDFLAQPDLQLNDFDYDDGGHAHYGAAYLFALYFLDRFGAEATQALVAHPANGAAGLEAVLEQLGTSLDFEQLFANWVAAIYLDAPNLSDGRYGVQPIDFPRPALAAEHSHYPVAHTTGSVHQFASDYIHFTGDSPVTLVFTGTQQVKLVGAEPHGGRAFWWSNRGDDVDTTLTRAFDFSGLETVTLDYWLWYDVEEGWDYAYLEVSGDGGRTWDTIQTPHTTNENPAGNNYGHGYTGVSGGGGTPRWIHEQVDLSYYAGRPALIRFEYITDGAIHETGLVLDDLSIPELSYEDGFESDDPAWDAAGFVRNNNLLPQKFIIQLYELGPKPRIRQLPLNQQGRARWKIPFGDELNEAVLVVSGATPVTLESASYAYRTGTD